MDGALLQIACCGEDLYLTMRPNITHFKLARKQDILVDRVTGTMTFERVFGPAHADALAAVADRIQAADRLRRSVPYDRRATDALRRSATNAERLRRLA